MKALAVAFLLLLCLSAHADDMRAYLRETQTLVRQGRHKEALDRMIWFHQHALEHDPSMYATRLTVALDAWNRLAGFYQPARTAMVAIRDRDEAQIGDRGGHRRQFQDLAAINQALGEPERTLDVFKQVHLNHPRQAKQYWDLVKDEALVQREFDLAKEYLTDVKGEFEKTKAAYERRARIAANRPGGANPEILRRHQETLVLETRPLVELAIFNGDRETSARIQQAALDLIEDPMLRDLLTEGLPALPEPLPPAEDPPFPEH